MDHTLNHLYWVRHGENRANLTKEFSSRAVDYPLTEKGVQQAGQTAEYFVGAGIHAVYASPLLRARQTGEIIAARLQLPLTVMDAFREIDVGALEKQPPSAALWAEHNRILKDWVEGRHSSAFPNGDDYETLWQRISTGLQEITRQNGQNIIVVGHGGSFAVSLMRLCPSADLAALWGKEIHNCSISELLLTRREGQVSGELLRFSSVAHLHGDAAALVNGMPKEGELAG